MDNPLHRLCLNWGLHKSSAAQTLREKLIIQGVLQQTQDRFQHMSDQIIRRIDDMTKRIDDLEKNISDVMAQNQIEQQQP
ncbi:unnamed protein product [Cylicostephanus goldi]|uniref:Uncharacterized protein n=1 Tax=Cylicostephanus goldi TaxID=71465 RepID=A0A3P7N6U4_CYLGO|nr:unnamed protein product [Cylicostephanus goldi]